MGNITEVEVRCLPARNRSRKSHNVIVTDVSAHSQGPKKGVACEITTRSFHQDWLLKTLGILGLDGG